MAIGARALLILGPSRAGKSRLAIALIGASTRRRPILLIGDDRIILSQAAPGLVARPHPRIAGFIERRGLGIVAAPFVAMAPVAAIVDLAQQPCSTFCFDALQNFPRLSIVNNRDISHQRDFVLDWWMDAVQASCGTSVLQRDM